MVEMPVVMCCLLGKMWSKVFGVNVLHICQRLISRERWGVCVCVCTVYSFTPSHINVAKNPFRQYHKYLAHEKKKCQQEISY